MWLIFAGILVILFFAWKSYSRQKAMVDNEPKVYEKGDDVLPDTDSDMQEQYAYRTRDEQ